MTEGIATSEILRVWRNDPAKFAWDAFGFAPDKWQEDYFRALSSRDNGKMRIALKACAGVGKTATEVISGYWFLTCFGEPGEHPKGACVSITGDNLKDNLF